MRNYVSIGIAARVSVQRAPLSIRAITEQSLENRNTQDFVDFACFVPGLITEDQGPGEKRLVAVPRSVFTNRPRTFGVSWHANF